MFDWVIIKDELVYNWLALFFFFCLCRTFFKLQGNYRCYNGLTEISSVIALKSSSLLWLVINLCHKETTVYLCLQEQRAKKKPLNDLLYLSFYYMKIHLKSVTSLQFGTNKYQINITNILQFITNYYEDVVCL